jgi:fumarylacetoacetase
MNETSTDATHDVNLQSWVESANDETTDFPIQNLPFGIFRRDGGEGRVGIAIGDQILDVAACFEAGLLENAEAEAAKLACGSSLNALMYWGKGPASTLRRAVSLLLRKEGERGVKAAEVASRVLIPVAEAELLLPAKIGDFTDFYSSSFHAERVGRMFRPDHPLLPNYKYVPIAYHGRASTIEVSGTDFRRPVGQRRPPNAPPEELPTFEPSRALDYEAEFAFFVSAGNRAGEAVPLDRAADYVFGMCLLNDWSARDIQAWEYQPLGPFLAKSFASTISPWVVTLDALAPFRVGAYQRPEGDPKPLPYLHSDDNELHGGLDIEMEIAILSESMRRQHMAPHVLSRSYFREFYWSIFQMLTHHTSNGCRLVPGDLIGTGTVSSSGADEMGSMIEKTKRGAEPLTLPSGESRSFVEDGDEIILRGSCEREGYRRIGFGECRAKVLSARSLS